MVTRKIIFRSCALSQASAESHGAIAVKRQNVAISFGFNTKKKSGPCKDGKRSFEQTEKWRLVSYQVSIIFLPSLLAGKWRCMYLWAHTITFHRTTIRIPPLQNPSINLQTKSKILKATQPKLERKRSLPILYHMISQHTYIYITNRAHRNQKGRGKHN